VMDEAGPRVYQGYQQYTSDTIVIYSYFALLRRRLASYEVLSPLKLYGIAWELRCLNESSVAHHQPEL
jgi:hypothetical protein